MLLLDRASRNIGDKILVDIYKLKARLDGLFATEPSIDMLSFVESILIENNDLRRIASPLHETLLR